MSAGATRTRYLLDTDTCIYALSGRHPQVTATFDAQAPGSVQVSVVTLAELLFGIAKSQKPAAARARVDSLLSVADLAALPVEAAEHYADIRAALERAGTPIGPNDLWIAAHARAAGAVLVTNNVREFERVEGLAIQNWAV
ncbi:PIN domain-containing protein [Nevskia sp.]|uniref:type II toxin-antitoxin system tRNA(fMet)-specific endonuclease VapC n=1 Tax=Nevskia sp. TaxID=1929292 RepID=UPI0025E4169E|nr:PIN domain-containing protein [Nevskia sp.]